MAKLKSQSTAKKRDINLHIKQACMKLRGCRVPETASSNKNASLGIKPFVIKLRRIKLTPSVQEKPKEKVLKKYDKKIKVTPKSSIVTSKADRPSQIYNFSQYNVEDAEDPAADIVSELIRQKKVRVATCVKGKGRPRVKRIVEKKERKKQIVKKKFEQLKSQCPTPPQKSVPEDRIERELEFENNTFTIAPLEHSSPVVANRTSIIFDETLKTYSPPKKMGNSSSINKAVQRVVSTPINGKTISSPSSTIANISDISLPGTVMEIANESPMPWRMTNKKPAEVFYVNSRNATINKSTNNMEETITNLHAAQKAISLNDSNAENISPPLSSTDNRPRNESLLSLRQQANPLVGRSHRSPLKTINILEVVNLPPWKPLEKKQIESTQKDTKYGFEEIVEEKNNSVNENEKVKDCDLFGFEEFIDSDGDNTILGTSSTESSLNHTKSNVSLKHRLKSLKRLRPKEINKEKEAHVPMPNLFNINQDRNNKKQLHINEMLCSTMISPNANKFGKQFGKISVDKRPSLSLFKDISDAEQTTFTEDEMHRTYVKPYKRKRKLRENLVMYLDSDESGEEAEGNNKVLHKHKYQRKDPKTNSEVEEFAKEFNEMCKDVESTELIIEEVT